ncbi:hypothetical protein AAFN85_08295 [Mucilaginibacter sp. CAU 1740]|uniref:hypothetical protein n=1 Tax=Mucilaginibacter sp. CAU 1740 TaxID=3140365 RepID=UPI00325A51D7
MYKTFLLLSLTILTLSAKAQTSTRYVPGYYFDNDGKKFTGTIKLNAFNDWFFFKAQPGPLSEKIKIEQVSAVVTNDDSLTVMTEDNKVNRKYFAKLRLATPVMRFYYKYKFNHFGSGPSMVINSGPGSSGGVSNNISWKPGSGIDPSVNPILMYADGGTTFELSKRNYIEVLSKAFADAPEVVTLIQDKKLKFQNVDEIFGRYAMTTQYKR